MAKYLDEKWWMHPQIVNGKACPEGFWADEVAKGHRGLDFLQWRKGEQQYGGPSWSLSAGVP